VNQKLAWSVYWAAVFHPPGTTVFRIQSGALLFGFLVLGIELLLLIVELALSYHFDDLVALALLALDIVTPTTLEVFLCLFIIEGLIEFLHRVGVIADAGIEMAPLSFTTRANLVYMRE
jgi:hypothetical protein